MEHSKEFLIQQFLQENDFEYVELNTIKMITRLYKLFKRKQKYKNNATKQLNNNFSKYMDEKIFRNIKSTSPSIGHSPPSTHIETTKQQQQQHQQQLQLTQPTNTNLPFPHLTSPPPKIHVNTITQDSNGTSRDAKHYKRKLKPKMDH